MTISKPSFLWKYTMTNGLTLYVETIAAYTRQEC